MKLIIVTAPQFFVEEDKIITEMFESGMDLLYLRKPRTSAMYSERLLTLIPSEYHRQIVTYDHFYLEKEFSLKGIHLNAHRPNDPDEMEEPDSDYTGSVSITCHNLDELRFKKKKYDHVFLCPIFDCITQPEQKSAFTSEMLRQAASEGLIDKRVMAFGGITADKILEMKDFGFGGVVVMGDLWRHFDPKKDTDFQEIFNYFKELRNLAD